ncbi:hypothetical protein ACFZDK_12360 [Streptomyces sp. NPDC007901]
MRFAAPVEMRRAPTRLGLTCHEARPVAPLRETRDDEDTFGW